LTRREIGSEADSAANRESEGGAGTLYVIATPIGNLEDVGPRALQILALADRIAAEDTRTTRKLLDRYGVKPRILEPYHVRNEGAVARRLGERLRLGDSVALVTDAGTPGVSDPAYTLIRAALGVGARVVPVPGPSAALAALVGSGLPMARFLFEGFPPRRPGPRRQLLRSLADLPHTLVFFESAPRLAGFLTDVEAVLGNRLVAIARELTKLHEQFWRGKVADYLADRAAGPPPRGELTVVVEGAPRRRAARED
jgi:16S rRNA (cytidine1402-2'-O)-methyltransferase